MRLSEVPPRTRLLLSEAERPAERDVRRDQARPARLHNRSRAEALGYEAGRALAFLAGLGVAWIAGSAFAMPGGWPFGLVLGLLSVGIIVAGLGGSDERPDDRAW